MRGTMKFATNSLLTSIARVTSNSLDDLSGGPGQLLDDIVRMRLAAI